MREEYTEVEFVSWGEKIRESWARAAGGVILVVLAFVLLFWNEGRINLAEFAKTSVEISASTKPAEGKFVSLSDRITANAPLGDGLFLLPGQYVAIDRTVEMYAWREDKQIDRDKHVGGSETRKTTYTYRSEWTNSPEDSRRFHHSQNHSNPPKAISDQLYKVPTAQLGRYAVEMNRFDRVLVRRSSCTEDGLKTHYYYGNDSNRVGLTLPENASLRLTAQNSQIKGNQQRTENYIFQGAGSPENPRIGDVRVCYSALLAQTPVTVFGKFEQNRIGSYPHSEGQFFRLLPGDRANALMMLGQENTFWKWVLRLVGFLCMWMGLSAIASPLVVLLDVIPLLGWIAESIAEASSFVTAFILSSMTILLSMLLYHPIALLCAVSATISILLLLKRLR